MAEGSLSAREWVQKLNDADRRMAEAWKAAKPVKPGITATEAAMAASRESRTLLELFDMVKNPPELTEAGRAEIAKANLAAANASAFLGFPVARNLIGQLWTAYADGGLEGMGRKSKELIAQMQTFKPIARTKSLTDDEFADLKQRIVDAQKGELIEVSPAEIEAINPALLPEWLRSQMEESHAGQAQRRNEGVEGTQAEPQEQAPEAVEGGGVGAEAQTQTLEGGRRTGKTQRMRKIFMDELRKSGSASIRALQEVTDGQEEARTPNAGEGEGDPGGGEDRRKVDHGSAAGAVRPDSAGQAADPTQAAVVRVCADCDEGGLTAEVWVWDGRGWKCLHHPDGEYLSDVPPPGRHPTRGKGWGRQLGWPELV